LCTSLCPVVVPERERERERESKRERVREREREIVRERESKRERERARARERENVCVCASLCESVHNDLLPGLIHETNGFIKPPRTYQDLHYKKKKIKFCVNAHVSGPP
jgi:hypothetical protein